MYYSLLYFIINISCFVQGYQFSFLNTDSFDQLDKIFYQTIKEKKFHGSFISLVTRIYFVEYLQFVCLYCFKKCKIIQI